MNNIQRFDLGPHQMTPSSEGAYVRYEDYAKLEKALEQATRNSWDPHLPEEDDPKPFGKDTVMKPGPVADSYPANCPELAAYLRQRGASDEE